jgi:hypothetical protein
LVDPFLSVQCFQPLKESILSLLEGPALPLSTPDIFLYAPEHEFVRCS